MHSLKTSITLQYKNSSSQITESQILNPASQFKGVLADSQHEPPAGGQES